MVGDFATNMHKSPSRHGMEPARVAEGICLGVMANQMALGVCFHTTPAIASTHRTT